MVETRPPVDFRYPVEWRLPHSNTWVPAEICGVHGIYAWLYINQHRGYVTVANTDHGCVRNATPPPTIRNSA